MSNASKINLRAKPDKVAAPTLSEQIALQVLSEAFSTLRIRVLKPEAISEIRAEVKRRVAEFELQQARQAELDQLLLIVAMREAA